MGGLIVQRAKTALVGVLAALSAGALASDAVPAPAATPAPWSAALTADALLAQRWTFYDQDGLCVLEQLLPGYGMVRFLGRQGESVSFELTAGRDQFAAGPVRVFEVAPSWLDAYPQRSPLGEILHIANGPALGGDPLASRLLAALEQGYAGELTGRSRFDAQAPFAVLLSPLGFRAAQRDFGACLEGQAASWMTVERSRVFHRAREWTISDSERDRLETLAAFVRADPTIRRVFVDGHTDDSGTASENLQLSKRRAEAVAAVLEAAGVRREQLVVRYHGERYPVAPNDTATNRAENRRTTIRLSREPAAALVQR